MTKVKSYMRLGMQLKAAGKIARFQVVNRKGQPILQTAAKNQNYADYQGDYEEEETVDDSQWTLVQGRRKRQHPDGTLTSPNSRPLADRPANNKPPPTAATWAALTEQEFPELPRQPNTISTRQPQPSTSKDTSQPATVEKTSGQPVARDRNQPNPTNQQRRSESQQQPPEDPCPAATRKAERAADRAADQRHRHPSGVSLMMNRVTLGMAASQNRRD
jgi:hypothetical protein